MNGRLIRRSRITGSLRNYAGAPSACPLVGTMELCKRLLKTMRLAVAHSREHQLPC